MGKECPDVEDSLWDEMIAEIDTDQDGEIDFEEFMTMMFSP